MSDSEYTPHASEIRKNWARGFRGDKRPGRLAAWDRWFAAEEQRIRADERAKVSQEIRDELVCCTEDDPCRLEPNICHWGREAAKVAEGVDND